MGHEVIGGNRMTKQKIICIFIGYYYINTNNTQLFVLGKLFELCLTKSHEELAA